MYYNERYFTYVFRQIILALRRFPILFIVLMDVNRSLFETLNET